MSIQFDVFSIIFIIIILALAIIGYFKGFMSLILGFAKGLVTIIVSALLAKPVGALIFKTPIGSGMSNGINGWLVGKDEIFTRVVSAENSGSIVNDALSKINIPEFIRNTVSKLIGDKFPLTNDVPIGKFISDGLSNLICVMIAFLILALIIGVVFFILRKLLRGINKLPIIGWVNRVLGLVTGIALALVITSGVCWLLSFVMMMPNDLASRVTTMLALGEGQENIWSVSKFIYQNNIIVWIFKAIF